MDTLVIRAAEPCQLSSHLPRTFNRVALGKPLALSGLSFLAEVYSFISLLCVRAHTWHATCRDR